MFKQQDIRWCGFLWSIPISIDYVWIVYIDMAISTPWNSCGIWNSYIQHHNWCTGLMRQTISHAGLRWNASLDGDIRYMDGRREWEDIWDSSEIWDLYIYIYIHYLLTYLYSYSINTSYHSVVSNNLIYSLCLIVCNVKGSVAMATRNHSTNGAYRWSGHIKTTLGIGLRSRPLLISVSPRYVFCMEYVSASSIYSLFL